MANCMKCGATLREGAKFCGACGAKIEIQHFCTECGGALAPGEKFCTQCGTPVEGGSAAKAASSKKPDYPDVRGFYSARYGANKAISISDRALVWVRNSTTLSRLDQNLHLISRPIPSDSEVVQTKNGILLLKQIDYNDDRPSDLCLLRLDDQLQEQEQTILCSVLAEAVAAGSFYHYMTQFDLFVLQHDTDYDPARGFASTLAHDISIRQISLSTSEIKEWKWDFLTLDGWAVDSTLEIAGASGNKLYLNASLRTWDNSSEAVLVFDAEDGQISFLWKRSETDAFYGGRPVFFDFEKEIMWTYPTQEEREQAGLKGKSLVARSIGRNTPILPNYPVWNVSYDISDSMFTYFDGQRFYRGDDEEFYSIDRYGMESDCWKFPGHRNGITAEETVIWNDRLIVDLDMGEFIHRRRCYPATFEGPDEEQGIWVGEEEAN